MYQGGTPGAYGYGQVHREFPHAQVAQQGKPPGAAITAPLDAAQPPPWAVLLETWAALNAVTEVVYALSAGLTPDLKGPPVAFPALGQWVPGAEDPRVPWRFTLPEIPPPPRPPFPPLGRWTPTAPPLDATFFSFRLRLARLTGPAVGPEAWASALEHTAALQALRAVVALVGLPVGATQDPAVRFPKLGQWVPTAEDPRVPWRFTLPQIPPPPPPPPPPSRSPTGQWTPTTPDLDRAYASYRLRLARLGPPVALPAIWPLEVANWAALNALLAVLYLPERATPAIPEPPLAAGRRGQWTPTTPDLDRAFASVRQRLLRVGPPPALPAIWPTEAAHWAALGATTGPVYLVARAGSPIPEPPQLLSHGQWTPTTPELDRAFYSFRLRLQPVGPPRAGPPVWATTLPLWAALSNLTAVTLLARGPQGPQPEVPAPPAPWTLLTATWAALNSVSGVVALVRPAGLPLLEAPQPVPPWVTAQAHGAALGALQLWVALERPATMLSPAPRFIPPWLAYLAAPALFGVGEVVYGVAGPHPPLREAPPPPEAWFRELEHWPALGALVPWGALVRPATGPMLVPVPFPPLGQWEPTAPPLDLAYYTLRQRQLGPVDRLVPAWQSGRDLWPAISARLDVAPEYAQRRIFPFIPLVIDYSRLGLVGVTVTNLRTNAIPIPPWLGGVVEETDPKLLKPGSIADGENFVPQRAPRLAVRGGSRIMLTLSDDAGTPAELSHVLGCVPKPATGAVLIGWSAGTTKHYAYSVTSDMAFAGASQALSRTAFPASWNRATPARPVVATLFEKLFVADATVAYAARNPLAVVDILTPPGITVPTFAFVPGGAAAGGLFAYCCEEYNNVLFIAGYGDEETGTGDDPALVRHSFLGQAPDAAAGFDKDAYNTIGSKGDRVTAMKKGRGLLVIAKANELYRLTGAGRAYPGWQYQVEGVHNTQGVGIENPLALEHAEGFWFGIGKQGPFRTDGYEVDPLSGPRQRTWASIDQLGQAWVRYHPERRVVLFGVHVSQGAPDATYPWVLLVWDCDRSVWQPNWKLAGTPRFFVGQAIASSTMIGPTGPPTAPNSTAVNTSGWTANWTAGDATAETEYWEQAQPAGAWVLKDPVLAPAVTARGVNTATNHTAYKWRVRHRKNGIYSPFSAEVAVQTLIAGPGVNFVSCDPPHVLRVRVTQLTSNATCTVQSSPHGAGTWTTIATFTNVSQDVYLDATALMDVRAKSTDPAWSVPDSVFIQLSNIIC